MYNKYEQIKENPELLLVDIKVKDDLGNEYETLSGGGIGKNSFREYTILSENLNEDAKKLYIIPYYYISKNGGKAIINEDDISEIVINNTNDDILKLDNKQLETIELDLENLK